MEKDLGKDGHRFLVGKDYTLADVIATVFCARIYLKREQDMFGPNLKKFWEKVSNRDSFTQSIICRM